MLPCETHENIQKKIKSSRVAADEKRGNKSGYLKVNAETDLEMGRDRWGEIQVRGNVLYMKQELNEKNIL